MEQFDTIRPQGMEFSKVTTNYRKDSLVSSVSFNGATSLAIIGELAKMAPVSRTLLGYVQVLKPP